MKKIFLKLIIISVCLIVVLSMSLLGCKATVAEETIAAEEETKDIWIECIVKLAHPWFDVMNTGMQEAAEALGVKVTMVEPAVADAASQIALFESAIAKGVDAIICTPNDTAALEPVLEKARDAGIFTIMSEGVTAVNADYDVEPYKMNLLGEEYINLLVKYGGEKQNYVITVGNLTADAHMERFEGSKAFAEKNYPELNLLSDPPLVMEENTQVAYEVTLELIGKYGDELNAIISNSAADGPGVSQAIEEKGLEGKILNIGAGLPSIVVDYIKSGSMTSVSGYNPAKVGYDCVWVANELVNGRTISDGQELPQLGKILLEGIVIYGGAQNILTWTKENIDTEVYF